MWLKHLEQRKGQLKSQEAERHGINEKTSLFEKTRANTTFMIRSVTIYDLLGGSRSAF